MWILLVGLALGDTAGGQPRILPEIPVQVQLRGAIIVNLGYNTGTLLPGSYGFFAAPPAVSRRQFFISPSNSVIGMKASGLAVLGVELSAALDVSLRSPTPLLTANVLAPLFYDAYIGFEGERLRLVLGQCPDVLASILPDTINSYPAGYLPGSFGFSRPSARVDGRQPVGNWSQLILQASASRPIQTFDLSDELVGRQAGVPDLQGRVAFAVGRSELRWERPFGVGVGGHLGRRLVSARDGSDERQYRTWSLGIDLRLRTGRGLTVKARAWAGALLGDYTAGIFQTVAAGQHRAVRARGLWLEAQQDLARSWRLAVGGGRDDPQDSDLDQGGRALNEALFANLRIDLTRAAGLGVELSRWRTEWLVLGTTTVWRADVVTFHRF